MLKYVWPELRHSVQWARVEAVKEFGFTERESRFLVHVLVFSGVFLERQYRAFMGLVHGQQTHNFLTSLVERGYATAITPGARHRGRFYHVHYKPLYQAIREPDNRHRRAVSLGRVVERLMLLDAVLGDGRHAWLGTEHDKRAYFRAALDTDLPDRWYPHVTFGSGAETTRRFFPEKLPIGVPLASSRRHVFLYLATREIPMGFRLFLLRHVHLLTGLHEWTVRVLMPRRLRRAAALYRYAVRDTLLMPLEPSHTRELDWYFRARHGECVCPVQHPLHTVPMMAQRYGAARFEALYRAWLQRGEEVLHTMISHTIRDDVQRGWGKVEFVELPHQYLQLTPLVGAQSGAEMPVSQADDLPTA